MRVLFIVHQFFPEFAAGTEAATLNLARQAQSFGHHVDVLTCSILEASFWEGVDASGLRRATVDGVQVHAVVERAGSQFTQYGFGINQDTAAATHAFLDSRPPYDLVHVTHGLRMLEAAEVVRERRLAYVVTLTDFFLECYRVGLTRVSGELCEGSAGGRNCDRFCPLAGVDQADLLQRQARTLRLLEGAEAITACSDYVADVVRRQHPHLEIRSIPHGVTLAQFAAPKPRPAGGELVIGYIGTLSQSKGVHILAEAFADALTPGARLELIGPCSDAAFRDRLAVSIARAPNITLRGPVPEGEIPARLAGFALLCLPSLVPETFSLALHEGFAAGLPCLVSDLGWPGRLVRRAGCGQAIAPADIAAWRLALTKIALDPSRLDVWRKAIAPVIDVKDEGRAYEQLYGEIVPRQAARGAPSAEGSARAL